MHKSRMLPTVFRILASNKWKTKRGFTHSFWSIQGERAKIHTSTSNYFRTSVCVKSSARADVDNKSEMVNVFLPDERNNEPLQYPWLWLRDNCQCSTCFHPVALNRTFNMDKLDISVKAVNAQVKDDSIHIKWSDDHESSFTLEWLRERAFTPSAREAAKRRFSPKAVLWNSSQFQDKIPSYDFTEVLEKDETSFQWLDTLAKYGLVLLKNAPAEVGQVEKITNKISFFRRTHYGDIMPIKVSEDPYSLAYTSNHLAFHTDTGWSLHPVGVQALHCIVQAKTVGGENEFVDTFNVAEQLKEEYPEEYKLLCETHLYHMDTGKDIFGTFYKQAVHPLFRFNIYGEIDQTIFSNISRDSFLNLPVEKVTPFLKALHLFYNICYDPKNIVRIKLAEGDIVMFNNTRVLHGRTAYEVTAKQERHLEAFYMDWEEILSRRFLLQQSLKNS